MTTAFAPFAHAETSIINIYDANGNLIGGDGKIYTYNDANKLVKVQLDDATKTVVAEFFYNYAGQRIKKIENGVTTYYVGSHFENQVAGPAPGNTSCYFADGERVTKKDAAGQMNYYHTDHLGGVAGVSNPAGTIIASTGYFPFGDIKSSTGTEKFAFTGKEKDKTDLYYFHSRYNSPDFRHFTQADIAEPDYEDPQDLNRYSYVGNNPLSYIDSDGFKKKKKHLSKREQRARSLGLNPDKDKYKVGKWSKREYKKALAAHKASKSKKSTASSSNYKLAGVGKLCTDVYCDIDPPAESPINERNGAKEYNREARILRIDPNSLTPEEQLDNLLRGYTKIMKVINWWTEPISQGLDILGKKVGGFPGVPPIPEFEAAAESPFAFPGFSWIIGAHPAMAPAEEDIQK